MALVQKFTIFRLNIPSRLPMLRRIAFTLALLCLVTANSPRATTAHEPSPTGDAVIRARAGGSEIVITTTSRLAGAIHSLTWNGQEFIDSVDHGRQLQSAASFDCAAGGPFWAECYNPTEAGCRTDGAGETSTSKLLRLSAEGTELQTTTQMAFWLAPGEKSSGRPALNDTKLSRHRVTKRVRIGYEKWANVIDYDVTFTVPEGERHNYAQFEAVTGYMPPVFEKFWQLDPTTGEVKPLEDGPGEQNLPVIFATKTGAHAMGVFSPDQPSRGFEHAGYGRFRFAAEKVAKWNCVFRQRNADGIAPGKYRFRTYVAVGTLDDVRSSLTALAASFSDQ
jgi:hypothetical protein